MGASTRWRRWRSLIAVGLAGAGLSLVPASGAVAADASTVVSVHADGYRLVAADGGIFSFGGAAFYGSTGNLRLSRPIVGMAATPSGKGYWLVASDGGIFSYGDAAFYGSTGNLHLNRPIVGMAATPTGKGYWLVASDGGIFSYGDAAFYGSTGNLRLNRPIVTMATTPTGKGYWLVASDGGIFSYGDAAFYGSTGNIALNEPIVGMAPHSLRTEGSILGPAGTGGSGGSATLAGSGTVSGQAANPNRPITIVEVSVDGGPFSTRGVTCTGCGTTTVSWSYTLTGLSDGTHHLVFRALDGTSAVVITTSTTIVVDSTAPALSLTGGPADGSATNDPTPTYSGTVTDAVSGVHQIAVSVDGGAFATTGVVCTGCGTTHATWTWTPPSSLNDAGHTVVFRADDIVGNVSVATSRMLTVDTIPPATPTVSPLPTVNQVNQAAVSLSGTTEPGSHVQVTISDGATPPGSVTASVVADGAGHWSTSPLDLSALRDGTLAATAIATDTAGNTGVPSSAVTATKDTTPPAVSVSSAEAANIANQHVAVRGTTDGTSVSVVASDGAGGHQTAPVAATISGTSWSATVDVSSLNDGTVTYTATATDAAGNTSVATETGNKDTVPPVLSAVGAIGGSAQVTLTFSEPVDCAALNLALFGGQVAGTADLVTGVSCAGASNATVTANLLTPPAPGDPVQITVGIAAVVDTAGNASVSLVSKTTIAS